VRFLFHFSNTIIWANHCCLFLPFVVLMVWLHKWLRETDLWGQSLHSSETGARGSAPSYLEDIILCLATSTIPYDLWRNLYLRMSNVGTYLFYWAYCIQTFVFIFILSKSTFRQTILPTAQCERDWLTPRSSALLEKPPVVHLLKNLTFYGTRRFITVFKRALY
jgi:hypothetical protein